MNRQLYQMGGIGTLPMDFGQPLQVSQPMMNPSFAPMQPMSNPMSNYGQTPLTMAGGGITRLGYQEGGMDQMMMEPQMQEQMMQAPMQGQMMPAAGGEEQGQNAILTIIQLLIEQGIDPETAKELAAQILEAFAQGGEPAVEALANQLEQEEGIQEPMMMAEGGLTSIDRARDMLQSKAPRGEFLAYINPQEAGILKLMGGLGKDINNTGVPSFIVKKIFKAAKSAVKGIGNAVKSIAKSPIGMIALSIAAPYAIGAMFPAFATLGGAGFLGGALRAGISNLAVQGIATGKINPKQALLAAAAGGALSSLTGPASAAGNIDPSTGLPTDSITGTITQPSIQVGALESNLGQFNPSITPSITGTITQPSSFFSPTEYGSALSTPPPSIGSTPSSVGFESDISSMVGKGPNAAFTLDQATLDPAAGAGSQIYNPGAVQTPPNIFERGIASVQDFGTKLISDPIGTIGSGIKSTYELAKEYPTASILAATAAIGALTPQQPGEPDDSYKQRKAEHDAKVAQYITQYGGGAKVYSPSFYAMEGAVDPFAGRSTYAADGGQITNRQNYFFGSKVSAVATPQSGGGTGGGSGMGGMMARLIQQNPQMFKPQSTTVKQPRTGGFIDINQNGIDDRDEGMMYGGRAGYAEGSISFERKSLERKGYGDMMKNMTPKEISQLYDSVMGTFSRRFQAEGSMPMGEPRRNQAGIMELDYRAKGGFVPPIGIKEKADDIPAMLSNNEFVFTADAVRAAGGGSVNKGAERMYGLMKQLEAGGVV